MRFWLIFLSTFIPLVLSSSDEDIEWLKLLNLPKPVDSRPTNVCQLNGQTVTEYVANNQNNGFVLIIKTSGTQQSTGSDFAQKSAQLLASRNITVCELSVSGQTASPFGTDGSVVVFFNGKQYQYFGRKTSSALLSYVLKLNTSHVRLITGKLDKIAYDLVAGPKLVGLFMPQTPDLIAYETVAVKYSPVVPFYLVTDRMVAKHLRLSLVGQINLVKPFEKVAITCPVNPATAQDIETFIEQNKGVVLKYLTEHNIFDPNLQNPNKTTLLAISDRTTAVGQYFHKILTRTVRNITRENTNTLTLLATANTAGAAVDPTIDTTIATTVPTLVNLDAIEILWIDPNVFPSINSWLDQIRSHNSLAAGLETYFGAINSQTNQTVWFDTSLVNKSADKTADETNLLLLKEWITSVIIPQTDSSVNTTDALAVQAFVKEPQSITVSENTEFVLECEVDGQVGDCLWLKDGQNIGFNLARVSPDYRWRNSQPLGDCSLVVAKAQVDRDDGEWVCEVTGDQTNPTITSMPAIVIVNSVPKTEL